MSQTVALQACGDAAQRAASAEAEHHRVKRRSGRHNLIHEARVPLPKQRVVKRVDERRLTIQRGQGQLSFPVSTISQWWVSRSRSAVVILASPAETLGHSAKARMVVTMIEVYS